MIFVLLLVVALTVWQYFLIARRNGRGYTYREIAAVAFAGAASGILIGLAARIGMATIGLANGAGRFTVLGSFAVVISFAGFGVILAIVYAGLFRRLLRESGLAYGCLLVLCTWYPLAQAAVDELTVRPRVGKLILISGVVVAAMWVPYAMVLERLISRRQGRSRDKIMPNDSSSGPWRGRRFSFIAFFRRRPRTRSFRSSAT